MKSHRFLIGAAVVLAVISFIMVSSAGSYAADSRAGEAFAAKNCSQCHAIGGSGVSPNSKAPPFRVIARRYKLEDLEEAFAEGIVTGHNAMPEFTLTPREIDNLLAHLRILKAR